MGREDPRRQRPQVPRGFPPLPPELQRQLAGVPDLEAPGNNQWIEHMLQGGVKIGVSPDGQRQIIVEHAPSMHRYIIVLPAEGAQSVGQMLLAELPKQDNGQGDTRG